MPTAEEQELVLWSLVINCFDPLAMMQLLNRNEIDTEKWDKCIGASQKPLVYAKHWFLDEVSPNWKALVSDDYRTVFPLTLKKHKGLPWLLQPLFCQQLGIFSAHDNPPVDEVLDFLPKASLGYHISLNMVHGDIQNRGIGRLKQNQFIDLDFNYDALHANYSKSTRKNLRKVQNDDLVFRQLKLPLLIEFFVREYGQLLGTPAKVFAIYQQVFNAATNHAASNAYGVFLDDKLLAAIGLIYDDLHIHTLMVASHEGKRHNALVFLIDQVIMKFSSSKRVFDFGGSDIESIAYFFAGFGANAEKYQIIKGSRWIPAFLLDRLI